MMSKKLVILVLSFLVLGCASWDRPKVEIGWSQEQVITKYGEPQETINSRWRDSSVVCWVYWYYDWLIGYHPEIAQVWIFFEKGRVVGWQD